MTKTHTPGPWIVYFGEDDFDVLSSRQGPIACGVINLADATLICAAPELLAALQDVMVGRKGARGRARAIMSKAKGGDQ